MDVQMVAHYSKSDVCDSYLIHITEFVSLIKIKFPEIN